KFGGLGVGCLQPKNPGLLGKWKWRFRTKDKALWNIVIKEFYGVDMGFNSTPNPFGCGISTDIIKAVKCIEGIDTSFKVSFTCKISNGSNTFSSKDPRCRNEMRLMDSFPRLFSLESHKECKISDHSDRWRLVNNV
ncbi:hypothetical protein Tco_1451797, partial [Tanacetum coccineum]